MQIVARGLDRGLPLGVKKVESVPGVAAATPYARDTVMIKFGDKSAFPMLRGLDLVERREGDAPRPLHPLGSLDDLDDDSIILSAQLAAQHRGQRR